MLQDPGTRNLIDSADEFQRRVLEELSEHVHRCEKEAAETKQAVLGDFMVGNDDEEDKPLLRIRFLCEPGQEARVISVDDSSGNEWRSATFH
jgi:hypothetical protein